MGTLIFWDERKRYDTLLQKGAMKRMLQTCNKCGHNFEPFSAVRTFEVEGQKVKVINIPSTKCNCDVHFSLNTLLTIEEGLRKRLLADSNGNLSTGVIPYNQLTTPA